MRSTTARLFCVASAATILAFAPRLRAQDGPARPAITEREPEPAMHAVWAELGGAALLYSVNYEFRPVPFVGLSGGLAVVPFCLFDSCHAVPIVPVTLRALIGYEAHALELGAGVTVALMDDDDARFLVPPDRLPLRRTRRWLPLPPHVHAALPHERHVRRVALGRRLRRRRLVVPVYGHVSRRTALSADGEAVIRSSGGSAMELVSKIASVAVACAALATAGCVEESRYDQAVQELQAARYQAAVRDQQMLAMQWKMSALTQQMMLAQAEQARAGSAVLYVQKLEELLQVNAEMAKRLENAERIMADLAESQDVSGGAARSKMQAALDDLRARRMDSEKRAAAYRELLAAVQSLVDSGQVKARLRQGRVQFEVPRRSIPPTRGRCPDRARREQPVDRAILTPTASSEPTRGLNFPLPAATHRYPCACFYSILLGSCGALLVCACSAAGDDSGFEPSSSGSGATGSGASGSTGGELNLGGSGVGGGAGGDCSEEAKRIYLVSVEHGLYSFDPNVPGLGAYNLVGTLSCPPPRIRSRWRSIAAARRGCSTATGSSSR